ncbi:MAG: hypothetical protein KAW12_07040 [Candidatus Aminicenantes bacterium]|nr:hypothetical protein [Candidatus Aminicenantes bacterium]
MDTVGSRLLNRKQVMEILNIKSTTYTKWIVEGKITPLDTLSEGKHLFWSREIEELIEDHYERSKRKREKNQRETKDQLSKGQIFVTVRKRRKK